MGTNAGKRKYSIYNMSLAFFAVPKKDIVGILMNKILREVYLVGIFA